MGGSCSWRITKRFWEESFRPVTDSPFFSLSPFKVFVAIPYQWNSQPLRLREIPLIKSTLRCHLSGTGKNLGVHAVTASTCGDSEGDHRVYLPSSPLSSAQRAWSNICAPRRVQRICCFFSIRQSTSWSTVDSTRAVDMRWPLWYSLPRLISEVWFAVRYDHNSVKRRS